MLKLHNATIIFMVEITDHSLNYWKREIL